jgi:hypothetical protein
MPSASSQSSSTSRCALLRAAEAALRLACVARQPNGDRRAFDRLPSRGADVAGVSPVVVQMWQG